MLVFVLLAVAMGPFIGGFIPEVKADISTNRTFVSTAADSGASYSDADFTTAWEAYTADQFYPDLYYMVGGMQNGTEYSVGRSFVYFDTSDLPNDANITSAYIGFYITDDESDTDFNVTLQGTGTYPHNPPVASDYWKGWYGTTTNFGTRSTSDGLSESAYWNITLSESGLDQISPTGTTRFCVRSQEDIDGSAPTGDEYIYFGSRDMGESYAPKLYVYYTVDTGDTYNYYFNGPYEDDGSVFDGNVTVTLFPTAGTSYEFVLSGDGATADSENYGLEQAAVLCQWNITSDMNYTRVIYFTEATSETVYVCVPDPDKPIYLYGFTVNDFYGVTNGYLESLAWVNGAYRVIERQPIDTINAVPFYMQWGFSYEMRVVCDEGSLSRGSFTALADTAPSITILSGDFPSEEYQMLVDVTAERPDPSFIEVSYTDNEDATYWVRFYIKHRLASGTYTTDYYINSTSQYYFVNWTSADPSLDYLVQVQAYRTDGVKLWNFYAPYTRDQTNIWEPLNLLGDSLPVEMQYVPATILIIGALLAFSFWHISAGAWIGWFVAAVMYLFGWLPQGEGMIVSLGFSAVVAAGITIGEFKRGERIL